MIDLADPKTDVIELYHQFSKEFVSDNSNYDFSYNSLKQWLNLLHSVVRKDEDAMAKQLLLIWSRNGYIKLINGLIGHEDSKYIHKKFTFRRLFSNPLFVIPLAVLNITALIFNIACFIIPPHPH